MGVHQGLGDLGVDPLVLVRDWVPWVGILRCWSGIGCLGCRSLDVGRGLGDLGVDPWVWVRYWVTWV